MKESKYVNMAEVLNQPDPWNTLEYEKSSSMNKSKAGRKKTLAVFNMFKRDEVAIALEEDPELEQVVRRSIDMYGAERVSLAYDEFLEFCGTGKYSGSRKEKANLFKRALLSLKK